MSCNETLPDFWIWEKITDWDIYQHGVSKVIAHAKTAYQEMYVVESGSFGKALVLDGKWQSSMADEFLYHEAIVHPAMLQHGAPRSVLILGGGEGATIREVLRWKSVTKVGMVDIDGDVVAMCKKHMAEMHQGSWDDPRVELVIGDALDFVKNTTDKWDVVIADLTDPLEEGPSFALFTKEFYADVAAAMSPGGVLAVQAGPVSPVEIKLHGRLVRTLGEVFPSVINYTSFVPTYGRPWGFAVCSMKELAAEPDQQAMDALIAEHIQGDLRLMDGRTLLGMMQTPKFMRAAVAEADVVYTLAAPPKFGKQGS